MSFHSEYLQYIKKKKSGLPELNRRPFDFYATFTVNCSTTELKPDSVILKKYIFINNNICHLII